MPNRYERFVTWTQAGFNNLDHNRDRRIAANEWHFDVETFRRVDRNRDGALDQTEFLGGDVDDARADSFDDLDWNNNGRVERSEWYGSARGVHASRSQPRRRAQPLRSCRRRRYAERHMGPIRVARLRPQRIDRTRGMALVGRVVQSRDDTNRDGMLSRQEFAASGGSPDAVGTAGSQQQRTCASIAQQRWTDTGIIGARRRHVTLDASGSMQIERR